VAETKNKVRRITTGQALRIAAWMRDRVSDAEDDRPIVGLTKVELEAEVRTRLGLDVSHATLSEIARNTGIDLKTERARKGTSDERAKALADHVLLHFGRSLSATEPTSISVSFEECRILAAMAKAVQP